MLIAAACAGQCCLPSSKQERLSGAMGLNTVEQVRRVFRVVGGFTLLLAGVVMLVTPGPGWVAIFLGLGLLAAEFVWARRLMDRMKREGGRLKDSMLGKSENAKPIDEEKAAVDEPPAGQQGS